MILKQRDTSQWTVSVAAYVFIGLFALICLIPFWLVYIGSFTAEHLIVKGFQMFPKEFTLVSYLRAVRCTEAALYPFLLLWSVPLAPYS
jgi:putative aldouronate transport system permease protein